MGSLISSQIKVAFVDANDLSLLSHTDLDLSFIPLSANLQQLSESKHTDNTAFDRFVRLVHRQVKLKLAQ